MNRPVALIVVSVINKTANSAQVKQNASTLSVLFRQINQADHAEQRLPFVYTSFNSKAACTRHFSTFHRNLSYHLTQNILSHNDQIYKNSKRHAGHSHWHNIQSTKGAKDKQKSLIATQMMAKVRMAIRDGGSADPKKNSELAKAIEMAKSKNVSQETIQNTLKKAESFSQSGKEEIMEASGPGGLMIIIQCFTDKVSRTKNNVQSKLKKIGASVGNAGAAAHSFERKGIVEIELEEGDSRDHDDHIELALEAEAEDVFMETREDGKDVLQFQCDHLQLNKVRKYLEEKGKNIIFAESVFIPLETLPIPEESMEKVVKLIELLKEFDEVEEVFTNVVPES